MVVVVVVEEVGEEEGVGEAVEEVGEAEDVEVGEAEDVEVEVVDTVQQL